MPINEAPEAKYNRSPEPPLQNFVVGKELPVVERLPWPGVSARRRIDTFSHAPAGAGSYRYLDPGLLGCFDPGYGSLTQFNELKLRDFKKQPYRT